MKRSGETIPVSGWSHRASTSNPVIVAGAQVDLRLEEGQELVMVEPEADALLDLALRDQLALHPAVEPQRARRARPLRAWSMAMSARRSRSGMLVPCGAADDKAEEGADLDMLALLLDRARSTRRSNCSASDERLLLLA